MFTYNTIHIFGTGEVQIIGNDYNKIISSNNISNISPFVNSIKSLAPTGVILTEYNVIHICENAFVRYLGIPTSNKKDITYFNIEWDKIPIELLYLFVAEIEQKISEQTPIE
jgi:hypothetical protein